MGEFILIIGLLLAIAVVITIHAYRIIRAEKDQKPGLPPGTGEHLFEVTYASGLGGGQTAEIRVPRDPQAYARQFVPKDRLKEDQK